jgi:hypothetical protein
MVNFLLNFSSVKCMGGTAQLILTAHDLKHADQPNKVPFGVSSRKICYRGLSKRVIQTVETIEDRRKTSMTHQ